MAGPSSSVEISDRFNMVLKIADRDVSDSGDVAIETLRLLELACTDRDHAAELSTSWARRFTFGLPPHGADSDVMDRVPEGGVDAKEILSARLSLVTDVAAFLACSSFSAVSGLELRVAFLNRAAIRANQINMLVTGQRLEAMGKKAVGFAGGPYLSAAAEGVRSGSVQRSTLDLVVRAALGAGVITKDSKGNLERLADGRPARRLNWRKLL